MGIIKKTNKAFASNERQGAKNQWKELSEYFTPNSSGNFEDDYTKGNKKTCNLYSSMPVQYSHDLAASLHSSKTNPATNWAKLTFKDEELNDNRETSAWLSSTNKLIQENINDSNFNTQVSKNYQAFVTLGSMALFVEEEEKEDGVFSGVRFEAWHLSQIAISENKNGLVDTVYRKFKLTAKQLIDKFDKVPDYVIESMETNPDREFQIYHAILPRDKKQVKINEFGLAQAKNRPFSSHYVMKSGDDGGEEFVLEEGGYYEFPVMVSRWSNMPGEVYGRGPGHLALPDTRSLNQIRKLRLISLGRDIRPTWFIDHRSIIEPIDMSPDAINLIDGVGNIRALTSESKVQEIELESQNLMNNIKSVFFVDKLLLPPRQETGEMTAFEVQQRLEQMQRVLGPTVARMDTEFLTPMVIRIFNILLRSGALPEIPQLLVEKGIDVNIRFVNPLNRAQEAEEINNIRSFLLNLSELAQVAPEVLDYIDGDAIVKNIADARGIPPTLLKEDAEVQQIRQQRAQQQQAQQTLDAGVGMADIVSKTGGGVSGGI